MPFLFKEINFSDRHFRSRILPHLQSLEFDLDDPHTISSKFNECFQLHIKVLADAWKQNNE